MRWIEIELIFKLQKFIIRIMISKNKKHTDGYKTLAELQNVAEK